MKSLSAQPRHRSSHRYREHPALLTVHDVADLLGITPCAVRTAITRHEIPWIRSANGARGIPADFQQRRPRINETGDIVLRGAVTSMLAIVATLVVALALGVLPPRSTTLSVDYRNLTPTRRQAQSCVYPTDGRSLTDPAVGRDNTTDPCGP
jgi:hypothetical protein